MPEPPRGLDDARAFWLREPGRGEIRPATLPEPGRARCSCAPLRSGVSRGTETLVFRGGVPPSQYAAMRAPFQEGDFPGPVKYGYLNVGVVEQGPADLRGRTVFCLYPHQTAYVVPAAAVTVGARRRAARAGGARGHRRDRRQRAVGRRAAARRPGRGRRRGHGRLLRRAASAAASRRPGHPGRRRPGRAARRGGARRRLRRCPDDAAGGRDLVVHTSATSAGLQRSLDLLAPEGTVIDLSWYGDAEVRLSLGGAFHSRRLAHPRQPGRHRRPRPARRPHARRPAGARARPAARPGVRRARHRRSPASTSCPT